MSTNSALESDTSHAVRMDQMYRLQRHIYDASRAYYLLGRDMMLKDVASGAPASVLEMGCGTGRNLVALGRMTMDARLYGLDISQEMLQSAGAALLKAGLVSRTRLAQGDATAFNAKGTFGLSQFDRVCFSYALSMIPDWQAALAQAWALTAPGGSLHVADFGGCERLPAAVKAALQAWLARFHVTPRPELERTIATLVQKQGGRLTVARPFRGYAVVLSVKKPLPPLA